MRGQDSGGLYIPDGSLARWTEGSGGGVEHVCVLGDSIAQGTTVRGFARAGWAFDGFADRLARALGATHRGGLVGAGFFGLWRSGNALDRWQTSSEWKVVGAWERIPPGDPFDIGLYREGHRSRGAENVLTWHRPVAVPARRVTNVSTTAGSAVITSESSNFGRREVGHGVSGAGITPNSSIASVPNPTTAELSSAASASNDNVTLEVAGRAGVDVAQIDLIWGNGEGSEPFSYSIDGGSTWIDIEPARGATASMLKTAIAVTDPATFQVRAADARGAARSAVMYGIDVYSVETPTEGVVVHNMAVDGGAISAGDSTDVLVGGVDGLRRLDNDGDSEQTASLHPSLCMLLFSNDMVNGAAGVVRFEASIEHVITRLHGYCDLLFVNPMEQSPTVRAADDQAAYRAALRATCARNGVAVLDLYDVWAAEGTEGFTACAEAGLMNDLVHPSLAGHAAIAEQLGRALSIRIDV